MPLPEPRSRRRRAAAHTCPRCKQPWAMHATRHPSGGWVVFCEFCSWSELREGYRPPLPVDGDVPGRRPSPSHAAIRKRKTWAHAVRFYDRDRDLMAAVAGFAADGWSAGDVVVLITTGEHRAALRWRLASHGLAMARAEGRLVELDAAETLASFMRDGRPDHALFDAKVGALVRQCAAGSSVRAFGEMVNVLWEQGNAEGALELEQLWAELQQNVPFTLMCGYAAAQMSQEGRSRVRAAHDHVLR